MNWTKTAPREEKVGVTGKYRPLRRPAYLKGSNTAEFIVLKLTFKKKKMKMK